MRWDNKKPTNKKKQNKKKERKSNCVEEQEYVSLFYPVKGVPGRERDARTPPDESVGVCWGGVGYSGQYVLLQPCL